MAAETPLQELEKVLDGLMDSNLGKPGDRSSPGSRHIARQSPLSFVRDHFSTKQGYFFNVSGTLDLVTGENRAADYSSIELMAGGGNANSGHPGCTSFAVGKPPSNLGFRLVREANAIATIASVLRRSMPNL
jgi:hypothetical protein